jgi:hypothetical protein
VYEKQILRCAQDDSVEDDREPEEDGVAADDSAVADESVWLRMTILYTVKTATNSAAVLLPHTP